MKDTSQEELKGEVQQIAGGGRWEENDDEEHSEGDGGTREVGGTWTDGDDWQWEDNGIIRGHGEEEHGEEHGGRGRRQCMERSTGGRRRK